MRTKLIPLLCLPVSMCIGAEEPGTFQATYIVQIADQPVRETVYRSKSEETKNLFALDGETAIFTRHSNDDYRVDTWWVQLDQEPTQGEFVAVTPKRLDEQHVRVKFSYRGWRAGEEISMSGYRKAELNEWVSLLDDAKAGSQPFKTFGAGQKGIYLKVSTD